MSDESAEADDGPVPDDATTDAFFARCDVLEAAAEEFKAMLVHSDWQMRAAGVRVLEKVRVKHFYQPLVPLLQDEDPRVQVAAIEAAGDTAIAVSGDVSVVADAVTTPYQAAVQAQVSPGSLAVVIGVGGVGGYAVQIANARGAKVVTANRV